MKRHLKRLAEWAGNHAVSVKEVSAQVPHALGCEFREVPLSKLRDALRGKAQASLFAEEQIGRLETIRPATRGSAIGNTVIDCVIDAVHRGFHGDAALREGMLTASDLHLRSVARSMEEHYRRKAGSKSGLAIRGRLDEARGQADLGKIVSDFLGPKRQHAARPSKRTGLDEGPSL